MENATDGTFTHAFEGEWAGVLQEYLDKKLRWHYTKSKGRTLAADWSAPYRHYVKKIDRSVGEQRRSIFFAFGIMFRSRSAPKDIPWNHPRHIDDADDDCSQKVQCAKNNIQNFHNGILLWVILCKHSDRPEEDKKLNTSGHQMPGGVWPPVFAIQRLFTHRVS